MLETRSSARSPTVALVLLAAALAVLAPHAVADEQADITFSMTSLEEGEVEGTITMSGEDAQEIREGADQFFGNGDGTVQPEEAQAMEDALEGEMDDEADGDGDVALDGTPYDLRIESITITGLAGTEVSSTAPVDAIVVGTATLQGEIEPGTTHTFSYNQDDGEALTFQAPPGYEITSTENVDAKSTCQASTDRGNDDQVTIQLTEAPGECVTAGSGAPGPGLLAGLLAAGLAALVLRKP